MGIIEKSERNRIIGLIAGLFDDPLEAQQILLAKAKCNPRFDFKGLLERQTEARKKRDENNSSSEIWILEAELDETPEMFVGGSRDPMAGTNWEYHGKYYE